MIPVKMLEATSRSSAVQTVPARLTNAGSLRFNLKFESMQAFAGWTGYFKRGTFHSLIPMLLLDKHYENTDICKGVKMVLKNKNFLGYWYSTGRRYLIFVSQLTENKFKRQIALTNKK